MHQKKVKELLIATFSYLKKKNAIEKEENKKLLAYICGFLTHYSLDKTAHPFVFARADDEQSHKLLELKLDTYLVEQYWGAAACSISPIKKIYMGKKLPSPIKNYYTYILQSVYKQNKQFNFINDSYTDCRRLLWFFYSPYKVKFNLLKFINLFTSMELTNYSYRSIDTKEILKERDYYQFENLFNQGVDEGLRLINLIDDYLHDRVNKNIMEARIPNYNFTGEKK